MPEFAKCDRTASRRRRGSFQDPAYKIGRMNFGGRDFKDAGVSTVSFEASGLVEAGRRVRWVKRLLDATGALALIAILLPLMAVISCAVRLQSPGPIIFRQARMGFAQSPFVCYKFRSMYAGAETRQPEMEGREGAGRVVFKLRGDPRMTPVGSFIRRWSLDELPQLFNVLKGEMSLVGPRPLPVRDHERLGAQGGMRLSVVPGITGLWQVSGRSSLTHEEMVLLDLHYIENWSLALDLRILFRTFDAVVRGKGAY